MASDNLKKILVKEVDRRQFLIYCGMVLLALSGISGFLRTISQPINSSQEGKRNSIKSTSSGFGAGTYGG